MNKNLQVLASKLGIASQYSDAGLAAKSYEVDDDTLRFFVRVLGYKANTENDIRHSLKKLEGKRWQKVLESVYVRDCDCCGFDAIIKSSDAACNMELKLYNRQKKICEDISYVVHIEDNSSEKYVRAEVEITTQLAAGYYDIEFYIDNNCYKSVLVAAPEQCYQPKSLNEHKIWGYALQLYSLRSKKNWGVGDFSDLRDFVKLCARCGADLIGLNPINLPNHCFPEDASPYLSISRLFLNPIYIDVSKALGFKSADISGLHDKIKELNASETIRYTEVYNLKMAVLEKLYMRLLENDKHLSAFKAFCDEQGEDLENLAAFQCLYEQKWQDHAGGWRGWEKEFLNPNTAAMKKYCEQNRKRLDFFKFLQFEAFRQFKFVEDEVKKQGMQIGIYRDLAVGVGRDSAELWSDNGAFLQSCGAGAPPDAFFPNGQKWNLGAFHPEELRERAYEPLIKILRAAMKGAGALRIDHVMSLMRLFIIPEADNKEGTYIYYNFDEMLKIVALESHLNKCLIVGESIGNVPEGFLDKIHGANIFSMSILWAERWDIGWGDFKHPHDYEEKAVVSIGTHDMAPLKMWWFGYDIELSRKLGLIATDDEMRDAYHRRETDRLKLLNAMDSAGVWPEDRHRGGNYLYGEGYPEGLEEAVHSYIAASKAKIVLIQPEDIFQVDKRQNLPGTDRDKHPNWRRKLPVDLEEWENNDAYKRNLRAIGKGRLVKNN